MRFLFLSLLLLGGCVADVVKERPTVEAVRPRIAGIDFSGIDLVFDADIRNPWKFAVNSPQFRYGMEVENATFSSGSLTTSLDLPARGTGTVSIPVRVSYEDVWDLMDALRGKNEIPYKLNGALLIPALGQTWEIPLTYSGTFPVLKLPDFTVVEFLSPKVQGTSATIGVEAKVTNPNVFSVGIAGLGYAFRLGNVEVATLKATTGETIEAAGRGVIQLEGRVSIMSAVFQMLTGAKLGEATLIPVGRIVTPYNPVTVEK